MTTAKLTFPNPTRIFDPMSTTFVKSRRVTIAKLTFPYPAWIFDPVSFISASVFALLGQ